MLSNYFRNSLILKTKTMQLGFLILCIKRMAGWKYLKDLEVCGRRISNCYYEKYDIIKILLKNIGGKKKIGGSACGVSL